MTTKLITRGLLAAAGLALCGTAGATEVRVASAPSTGSIIGIDGDAGQIGCALHAAPETFPMERDGVEAMWVAPQNGGATCVFGGVADGAYAVAVSHDLNGNQETDTNFLGMPTEAWGVSGNVRPTLRAPRFDEAVFSVAGKPVTLTIEVDK